MSEYIYLNDDVDSTVDRILADEELNNCDLGKRKVLRTLKSFKGDEIATSVFLKKYALKDDQNIIVEYTLEEAKDRWAIAIASVEKVLNGSKEPQYFRELYDYFLPAGRQMYALGNPYVANATLSNCYVVALEDDSLEGIFDAARKMAKTYSYGGGVGLCIGKLRPRGAKVSNSAKHSTGSVSFMELYSMTTGVIGQFGRRGALLLSIPVDHPDIEEFIDMKSNNKDKVRFANISVKITDKFMEAVVNDEDFELSYKTSHEVISKTVRAKELWNKIVTAAHNSAEPGILFFDTAKNMSPSDTYEGMEIQTTNPCITGDTLVYVADGRGNIPIKQLADEGLDVPVFCVDNNGKPTVRTMRNPRLTGQKMPVYKVKLDDGSQFRATANHEVYLLNMTKKRVCDLKPSDRFRILTTMESSLEEQLKIKGRKTNYRWLMSGGSTKYGLAEHRLVAAYYENRSLLHSEAVHHKNYNGCREPMLKELCQLCKENKQPCRVGSPSFFATYDELKEFAATYNHRVVSVEFDGYEDVYNGTVDEFHNFAIGCWQGKSPSGKNSQVCVIIKNCGELYLEKAGACCLGSLLLHNFVENPYTNEAFFNYDLFKEMVRRGARHLDNVVELNINRHALEEQKQAAITGRRIGLGITGLADMLAALNIKYDSDEALKCVGEIMSVKMKTEYIASSDLARERGSFEVFDGNKHFERGFCKLLPDDVKEYCKSGLRNVTISTVAPSGSVSIIGQCSSGIEPIFSLQYKRYVELGKNRKEFTIVHPGVRRFLNARNVDEFLPSYWVVSHDIDYNFRIKMQAIIQSKVDSSISSTVNLPSDVSPEVVGQIYIDAWREKLKGITVYREGSREGILLTDGFEKQSVNSDMNTTVKCVRAEGGDKFYIMVSYRDGDIKNPYQVFVLNYRRIENDAFTKISNSLIKMLSSQKVSEKRIQKYIDRSQNSLVKLTRFLSLSMKTGNLDKAVEILEEHAFAGSLASRLYNILSDSLEKRKVLCQRCKGSNLRMEEGCVRCLDCNWSGCN
jgi:ribonucleoside-diphosphate reductase alpha chain